MKNYKKVTALLIVIMLLFNINVPKQNIDINNSLLNEQATTSTDDGIMTVADPIGIVTSDFNTLKQYLELNDGNEYHMHLQNSITVTETIQVYGTKEIYLFDYSLTNAPTSLGESNEIIHINSGATLTVRNGTFNGSNITTTSSNNITSNGTLNVYGSTFINSAQGIHISTGGVLNFYSGTIKNNSSMGIGAYGTVNIKGGSITGAGQGIHINGGKLTITAGNIYSNTNGVYIKNGGTATISGGSIYSNTANGVYLDSGTFTASGGTLYSNTNNNIYGNTSTTVNISGATVKDCSYGIYTKGTLNISSGTISGNTVGAHVNSGGTAKITGGSIYSNTEGITITSSTVTMSNGNIYSNVHGLVLYGTTGTMSGGSIYNSSVNGVVVNNTSTFTLSAGSIYGCSTNGIKNYSGSTTNIKGGSIYSNSRGILNNGTLSVTAGTFKTNTATDGSAIYQNGTCTITGGTFESDQNIYLVDSEKYVSTNTSYPSFTIKPNEYTRNRVIVKTSGSSYASTEISNVALYPSTNWYTRVSGSNIVLWNKSKVTAKYQDSEGNTLADSVVTEDWVEASYTTSAKTIDGYVLTDTPNNATGEYTDSEIEVIYVYELESSQVEVVYINQETGEVLEKVTIEGAIGSDYTTQAREISGYELVVTPENASGTITEKVITVTYEYLPINGSISVTEVDKIDNTKLLSGSTIRLEKLDSDGNIDDTFTALEYVTDENGIVEYTQLQIGNYRLTQIVAPTGYQLKETYTDIELTLENRDIDIIWKNIQKIELPKTGSINNTMVICTIGIIIIILSISINKKKKEI